MEALIRVASFSATAAASDTTLLQELNHALGTFIATWADCVPWWPVDSNHGTTNAAVHALLLPPLLPLAYKLICNEQETRESFLFR